MVGHSYYFDALGCSAKVTAAAVNEQSRAVIYAVVTADGRTNFVTSSLTPDEFNDFLTHRAFYFGPAANTGGYALDPYELFEWFVEQHWDAPRVKLLEMAQGLNQFDFLGMRSDEELLEVCQRLVCSVLATAVWRDPNVRPLCGLLN